MSDDGIGRVEDYTGACMAMAYIVAVIALVLVWGAWSYVAALALCGGAHLAIGRLDAWRTAREAEWDARVQAAVARGRRRGW